MWRPDIEEVGKKFKKKEIEMNRGPDRHAANVVMNCQMCVDGQRTKFHPRLTCSLFAALLFLSFFSSSYSSFYAFTRILFCSIHPILYLEFTVPGALSPIPFPSILADQFRSCSFSCFLATSLRILPVKSPYLTRSFISQFYKKDGQLYVDRICRRV